jgi:RNA polymerase sigma-70 factor, ECF subfamily
MITDDFATDITECLPRLKVFAFRFAKDRARAEDLVQETVLRALVHADQFRPGTNLIAWLTTILRNCHFNELRSANRLTSLEDIPEAGMPATYDSQDAHLRFLETERRLGDLPAAQREAIALVAVNGYSYEEAAQLAKCAIGTMKSRVSRARAELASANQDQEELASRRFEVGVAA